MHKIPETVPLDPNDMVVENITENLGFYFRTITLREAGLVIPKHVHDYDHATLVGHGKVRAWQDDQWVGDFEMGDAITIPANTRHVFQSLLPDTVLTCVHNIESAMSLKRKGF